MLGIPSIVPYGADQTLYLVLEAAGPEALGPEALGPEALGLQVSRLQTAVERTDIEVIITDLLSGRFNDPIGIVAFNTLEHWTKDVSKDIAREIQCRCDIEGDQVPDYLTGFIETIRLAES